MQRTATFVVLVGCIGAAQSIHLRSQGLDSCGLAPSYENAKTSSFADSKKTAFSAETKKQEPVNFKAGDTVEYTCVPGFTTDGSKDGVKTFEAECSDKGYFTPGGVCVEASKCGALPKIPNATQTGKVVKGKTEFACNEGYSLDGEKVVGGGMGSNRFFQLKCVEFSGAYEEFTGECKPYSFLPVGETLRIYNKVGEALFIVSCKSTLKKSFGKEKTPAGLDNICAGFGDSSSACAALVTQIKADFETQQTARKTFDENKDKEAEWFEEKDPTRPGIAEHATTFCTELWGLLAMPSM
jgi:hypothetical protein